MWQSCLSLPPEPRRDLEGISLWTNKEDCNTCIDDDIHDCAREAVPLVMDRGRNGKKKLGRGVAGSKFGQIRAGKSPGTSPADLPAFQTH